MISLLLVASLLSAAPAPQCVKVCPTHKPRVHKKVVKAPPVKVKVRETAGQQQQQSQQQQVVVVVGNGASLSNSSAAAAVVLVQPAPAPVLLEPVIGIGLRGALGLWPCPSYAFALVGARVRFPVAHLGLDLATQFYYGHSLALLVYPVQTPFLNWHLDVGGLLFYHDPFSAGDVKRTWDLTLGTGVEVPVLPHVSFTADLRTAMPNPIVMTRESFPDAQGRHLNAGDVVGNSLWHSQLMVGLMLHTW